MASPRQAATTAARSEAMIVRAHAPMTPETSKTPGLTFAGDAPETPVSDVGSGVEQNEKVLLLLALLLLFPLLLLLLCCSFVCGLCELLL